MNASDEAIRYKAEKIMMERRYNELFEQVKDCLNFELRFLMGWDLLFFFKKFFIQYIADLKYNIIYQL